MHPVTLERIGELAIEYLRAQQDLAAARRCAMPGIFDIDLGTTTAEPCRRAPGFSWEKWCDGCRTVEPLKDANRKARRRLRDAVRRYEKGATR